MTPPPSRRRPRHVRCTLCGLVLPGWLVIMDTPDVAMLLHHLSGRHRGGFRSHLERMRTECLASVVMELFERLNY